MNHTSLWLRAVSGPTDHRNHRRRIVDLNRSDDFEAVPPIQRDVHRVRRLKIGDLPSRSICSSACRNSAEPYPRPCITEPPFEVRPRSERRQKLLELAPKGREILLDYLPDDVSIDPEVVMDQDVAHANNLGPWHVRRKLPDVVRNSTKGLAENLKMPDNPVLDQLLVLEDLTSTPRVAVDALNGLQRIAKALSMISQRGTASRSTRARIRECSPRSETTSTCRPRSS